MGDVRIHTTVSEPYFWEQVSRKVSPEFPIPIDSSAAAKHDSSFLMERHHNRIQLLQTRTYHGVVIAIYATSLQLLQTRTYHHGIVIPIYVMPYIKIRRMSAMHIHENERVYLSRGENVDIEISIHSKSRHFCPSVSEWNCPNLALSLIHI